LTTLNEPLFVAAAQALAMRTLQDGGKTDQDRLIYAFRRCVARPPTQQESEVLLKLLDKQRTRLSEGWLNAKELAGATPPPGATPSQLAAWTAVSRVLLNLDETITKE